MPNVTRGRVYHDKCHRLFPERAKYVSLALEPHCCMVYQYNTDNGKP